MEKLPELIDTHAHLDFPEFAGSIPATIERALHAGVSTIVTIGIDIETSRKAAQIAGTTTGFTPQPGSIRTLPLAWTPAISRNWERVAANPKVIAIGEIGLDYFRNIQPHPIQIECMTTQIETAVKMAKPVIFHIRDAWEDFFRIASEFAPSLPPSVMHCFSGDWSVARRCLDLGFYLSIPGVVTYPKAQSLQDVVMRAPLDRLLVETDSPYLAPVPYRGKTNEPAFVYTRPEKSPNAGKNPLKKWLLILAKMRGQSLESKGGVFAFE